MVSIKCGRKGTPRRKLVKLSRFSHILLLGKLLIAARRRPTAKCAVSGWKNRSFCFADQAIWN